MPLAPNLVNETFEGAGYTALTGAATVAGTSVLDPDYFIAPIAGNGNAIPPGWGEQAMRCVSQGANTEIRKQHNLGAAETGTVWFRDEIWIASESIADASETTFFTAWNLAFNNNLFHIKLRRDLPDLKIQFVFNNNGAPVISTYTIPAFPNPRKYSCEVMFNLSTHDYEARVNGVTVGSGNLGSATQTQFQTLIVGSSIFTTTGPTTTILHDNIGVSNQGWMDPSLPVLLYRPLPGGKPQIIDTFDRTVGSGAGTANMGLDPNKAWTTIGGADADVTVDGDNLQLLADTTYWHGIIGSVNSDPIVEVVAEAADFWTAEQNFKIFSVYPRIMNTSNLYEIRFNNDQGILDTTYTFMILRISQGAATTLKGSLPVGGFNRLSNFFLKGRAENSIYGVFLRFKIWESTQAEPNDWNVSVLDDQPGMITAGRYGLRLSNMSTTNNMKVKSFQATTFDCNPLQLPPAFMGNQA